MEDKKGTYFTHIFIFPLIFIHHSTISSIFSLLCFSLQGDCVFYRIPCKPTRSPENLQDDPVGITVARKTYRKKSKGTLQVFQVPKIHPMYDLTPHLVHHNHPCTHHSKQKGSVSTVSASHRKKKKGKQRGVRSLPEFPLLYTHSYSFLPFTTPSSHPQPTT